MKVQVHESPPGGIALVLDERGAEELKQYIDTVLDECPRPEELAEPAASRMTAARVGLATLHGELVKALVLAAHVAGGRPTTVEVPAPRGGDALDRTCWEGSTPQLDHTEPEPSGRPAELPNYIDVVASHIKSENRQFTVRVYRHDFTGRRVPNETQARVFDKEEQARDFSGRVQNIQNMKVRAKEAPGFDVVLGVQDRRDHAKKKSYRELEVAKCNGGPG